jgi:ribonucleotide reductase beta subunit family protein with ferritin-like domain
VPNNKYSIFPINNHKLWDLYKKHVSLFWLAEHVDLADDLKDFPRLSDDDWYFIKNILAFFNQSDGIVNENLAARFYNDVNLPEAKAFYSFQMFIETVHAETYSRMLDVYVKDEDEKAKLFNAIEHVPGVQKKAQWALKWINSQEDFAKRLVAFAIVEGVFFSGAFCAIFWLRKRGILPGLAKANDYISRDEGLHCDFAVALFKEMKLKMSQEEFKRILTEAVAIEQEFVVDSLPVDLIGMNSRLMAKYIEFVADRLSVSFGFTPVFNTANPFDFMNMQGMSQKTNFFERRVSDYSKSMGDRKIKFDEEF